GDDLENLCARKNGQLSIQQIKTFAKRIPIGRTGVMKRQSCDMFRVSGTNDWFYYGIPVTIVPRKDDMPVVTVPEGYVVIVPDTAVAAKE
ncbi:MAG: hypothetical protein Greene101449_71, partial [Candidatus Peregrinibacteria bacterium Greene1014_49]